jgi:hypothetical protein
MYTVKMCIYVWNQYLFISTFYPKGINVQLFSKSRPFITLVRPGAGESQTILQELEKHEITYTFVYFSSGLQ